ncbi:MAG: hypothetical protein CMJ18_03420 [Phycisphaeraceae bacterium]|nr:hypothetical protein [Phycisphaeraceae bacterium]
MTPFVPVSFVILIVSAGWTVALLRRHGRWRNALSAAPLLVIILAMLVLQVGGLVSDPNAEPPLARDVLMFLTSIAALSTIFLVNRACLRGQDHIQILNKVVDQSLDGFAVANIQARVQYANRAWLTRHGWSASEVIGESIEIFHNEKQIQEQVRPALAEIRTHGTFHGRIGHITRDGKEFPTQMVATTLRDESEQLIGYVGVMRDITSEERMQKALDRATQRSEFMLQHTTDGFYVLGPDGSFRDVNAAFCAMTGYTRKELLEMPIQDVEASESPEEIVEHCRIVIEQGSDLFETRHRCKDGSIIDLEINATYAEQDGEEFFFTFARDIGERKRSEAALRASEQRLALAMQGTELGLWDWEVQTGRVYYNDRWATMLGYRPDEIEPHFDEWARLVHPDDLAPVTEALAQHVAGDSPGYEAEIRMKSQSGEWKWILTSGKVVEWNERGEPIRAAGTHRDIDTHKRLEEQLRQSQKLEAVGMLAAGVAHDFQNFLTAIGGYSDLARKSLDEDNPVQSTLKMIEKSTQGATEVTRSLLTFARAAPAARRPVDLDALVRDATNMIRRLLTGRIEMDVVTDPDRALIIRADSNQIEQVLMNLVLNARDAMPEGGRIRIRVGSTEGDPDGARPEAFVEVEDEGHGIAPEIRARMFEPFFTTKERGKGTGLGLAVAHGIMAQHGGRIEVDGEPGRGTRVSLFMPTSEAKAPAPSSEAGEAETESALIVLAVANEYVSAIITTSLETAGYRVVAAVDASEAMNCFRARHEQAHLVILDAGLPADEGFDCREAMSRMEPDMRFITIMGSGDVPGNEDDGRLMNLPKPFKIEKLMHLVVSTLAADEIEVIP